MRTIKLNIRKTSLLIATLGTLFLSSCGGNLSDDKAGFQKIESELKSKFGDDAYYTNISIAYTKQLGLLLDAAATEDPSSLKLEEWNWVKNDWTQKSEITLEITGGKPKDFMFILNDQISISKMGELLEVSKQKLKEEKDIEAILSLARIDAPDNGDKSKMAYNLTLEPENGGTSFYFTYDFDGNLKDFTY
ncbi:hypothetical protein [Aquimarina sp. 2201CG5-10]|uniref:hypothetical protein n=1 Tax=Aquimarina callyspongiae TaxID=3098150 RepID=UPI002AB38154|nr:hypothetical protein [Aquimarina sp. 2201CG5-10]MDY8136248.1 hypothetical protein [Aquimarina sp. 2201CG5-10]